MAKRKSIGNDPLDWIGERGALPAGSGPDPAGLTEGRPWTDPRSSAVPGNGSSNGSSTEMVPVPAGPAAVSLERQLLLVDSVFGESRPRGRLNQVLWALLLVVTMLGMGMLFFQEARRHWNDRVSSMEAAIDRLEKEKGRNERMLEQVISEKDGLIREKQGTISKIEVIHQSLAEELRLARGEAQRLKEENRSLFQRFLDAPRWPDPAPPPEAKAPEGRAGAAPASAPGTDAGSKPEAGRAGP